MVGLASAASFGLGVLLACRAQAAGLRMKAYETTGGLLLVSSLVLLGTGLPLFR